jgi:hypothetical protein
VVANNHPSNDANRNAILTALWKDDIASVERAKIPARLQRGDEFIDLQLLEKGVQRAVCVTAPTGGVLPRKAVQANTWLQILARLTAA